MRLLISYAVPLLLAAARHEVSLVSPVFVPAFTAIELVPPIAVVRQDEIVAILAVDHILAAAADSLLIPGIQRVGTRPAVEDVAAESSVEHVAALVIALPTIGAAHQEVVAPSAVEVVLVAKATYLVIPVLTRQIVRFVGAREQAALGAAGYIIR